MGDIVQFRRFTDEDLFASFVAESPPVDEKTDREVQSVAARAVSDVTVKGNSYRSACAIILLLSIAGFFAVQSSTETGAHNDAMPAVGILAEEPQWRRNLASWGAYIESLESSAAHRHWQTEKQLYEAARARH